MIRLRGEWIPMDPRGWNAEMDCTTNVGLGDGSKDQQVSFMQMLLQIQAQIVQVQGSPSGPLVDLDKIHNTLAKLTSAMGIKNTDAHFNPPPKQGGYQLPPPPPNPDIQKAQMQQQTDQGKLQLEQQKLQADQQKHAMELEAQKEANAHQMMYDGAKTDKEMALKEHELALKFELEKQKLQQQAVSEAANLGFQTQQADQKHQTDQAGMDASNKDAEFNRQMQMIDAQGDENPGNKIAAVENLRKQFAGEKDIASQGLEEAKQAVAQAVQAVQTVAQQAVQQVAAIAQQAKEPTVERRVIDIVPGSIRRDAQGNIIGAETVTRAA